MEETKEEEEGLIFCRQCGHNTFDVLTLTCQRCGWTDRE